MNHNSNSDGTKKSSKENVWVGLILVALVIGVAIGFAIESLVVIIGCCIGLGAGLGYLLGRKIKKNRINKK